MIKRQYGFILSIDTLTLQFTLRPYAVKMTTHSIDRLILVTGQNVPFSPGLKLTRIMVKVMVEVTFRVRAGIRQ